MLKKIKFPCLLEPKVLPGMVSVMFVNDIVGVVLNSQSGHYKTGDISSYNLDDFQVITDESVTLFNDEHNGVWRI